MSKAVSLHVGVGTPGGFCAATPLKGAEGDARVMREIARQRGFKTSLMIGAEATLANLTAALDEFAAVLAAGDTLLVTYSGHGTRIRDVGTGSNSPESDGLFEAWCLADQQITDVQVYRLLTAFADDVRIIVIADCCYSGGLVALNMSDEFATVRGLLSTTPPPFLAAIDHQALQLKNRALLAAAPELLPEERAFSKILNVPRRSLFTALLPAHLGKRITANVLVLASALDNELSPVNATGGIFTLALLEVWDGGNFTGSYPDLVSRINSKVSNQTPNIFPFGNPCPGLLRGAAFTSGPVAC